MGGAALPRPPVRLHVRWLREDRPGKVWADLFARTWPSYRKWFLEEGDRARPSLSACRDALERHMPELLPTWERLADLTDGDPDAARMLSLYRPTPYLMGCSQAVWSRGEPVLVRNYDYHPAAWEGTFLHGSWNGTRTLVASDCLWGVLDGINEHGLAVSLAFGGRREVGDGFGIPLILRYVLETCRTVADSTRVLARVPSHMSYNVSLLDGDGTHAVAAVAPDRSIAVLQQDVATNHQHGRKWTRYDRATKSAERERYLQKLLANKKVAVDDFVQAFLRPPLYNTRYDRALGTLYTCVYRPRSLSASYLWPTHRVDQSIEEFAPQELEMRLGKHA